MGIRQVTTTAGSFNAMVEGATNRGGTAERPFVSEKVEFTLDPDSAEKALESARTALQSGLSGDSLFNGTPDVREEKGFTSVLGTTRVDGVSVVTQLVVNNKADRDPGVGKGKISVTSIAPEGKGTPLPEELLDAILARVAKAAGLEDIVVSGHEVREQLNDTLTSGGTPRTLPNHCRQITTQAGTRAR